MSDITSDDPNLTNDIIDLQIKVAYLERTIDILNDVL